MNRALGRKQHDPLAVDAAPKLADYAVNAPPPPSLPRTGINYQPQMWGNADYPTCTAAGLLNGALASEALSTNSALNIAPLAWMPVLCSLCGLCRDAGRDRRLGRREHARCAEASGNAGL